MILSASAPSAVEQRQWLYVSCAYALLVAAVLGYFLLRIPIQVTDSFQNMLALDRPFWSLMNAQLADRSYFRPGLWAALKIVYDASAGEFFYWFRWVQAAQVAAVLVLFVRMLQPRSAAAAAAAALGVAALVGGHTFAWTVREAFPINTFLTIVVCCAAAANLAFARHRWWIDVLAVLLLAFAVLTVESGVLVWVIFAGGYMVGLRGVSRRGAAALTLALAGYFVVRAMFAVGVPGLAEREAGFGFARRSGAELQQMFGANPLGFYAYNVASAGLGVLFAEPRDGVWRLTRAFVRRQADVPQLVNVVSSTLATLLIARYAWRRREAWRARRFGRRDQVVLLFGFVLAANAAICYAYTKDVIMSPAGLFFAAALAVSCADLLERRTPRPALLWPALSRAVVAIALAVLSTGWALRAVGLHAALARTAVQVREQWATVEDWMERVGWQELTPRERALKQYLQDDAVLRHPPRPPLREQWTALFDTE